MYTRNAGRKTLILLGVMRSFMKRQSWKNSQKLNAAEKLLNRDLATSAPIARVGTAAPNQRTLSRSSRLFSRHLQTFTTSFGASAILPSSIHDSSLISKSIFSLAQPVALPDEELPATENVPLEVESPTIPVADAAESGVSDKMRALHLYAMLGLEPSPSAEYSKKPTARVKSGADSIKEANMLALGAYALLALEDTEPRSIVGRKGAAELKTALLQYA